MPLLRISSGTADAPSRVAGVTARTVNKLEHVAEGAEGSQGGGAAVRDQRQR